MTENNVNAEGMMILENYKIIKKIGQGAFGEIFIAINSKNHTQYVAIKLEPIKSQYPQLISQSKLLQRIHSQTIKQGIPQIYTSGIENGYNVMIMELLDKNLNYYFLQKNKKFSLTTVLMIGLQLLERIQILHNCGFIHRDIKPDNIMLGQKDKSKIIYLIDMGLSKRYINDQNQHIYMKKGNQIVGALRYASVSNHKGIEQSRRDDLQSLGYVLLYFLLGSLPWQNMKAESLKTKIGLIKNKKINISPQNLCKGQPQQFSKFISYVRGLKFQEAPNYSFLKSLLKQAAEINNISLESQFDWEIQNQMQNL